MPEVTKVLRIAGAEVRVTAEPTQIAQVLNTISCGQEALSLLFDTWIHASHGGPKYSDVKILLQRAGRI